MGGENLWVIFTLHGKKENTWFQIPAYFWLVVFLEQEILDSQSLSIFILTTGV